MILPFLRKKFCHFGMRDVREVDMGRIILVRHGDLERDPHILVGQKNLPLSPLGADQMRSLARSWPPSLWEEIVCVISSDLSRCVESARILLGGHPAIPFRQDSGFREISLGCWEGLNKAVIEKRWPGWLAMRGLDIATFVPPGGESYRAFQRRILNSMACLRSLYPNGTLCLVTHAGVIRVLLAKYRAEPLCQVWRMPVDYASWFELSL